MSIDLDPKSPERWVRVGRLMDPGTQSTVEQVLKENMDIFAWRPEDTMGIDLRVVVHKLNVRPDAKPVKQKRRHFGAQ